MAVIEQTNLMQALQAPPGKQPLPLQIFAESGMRLMLRGLASHAAAALPRSEFVFGSGAQLAKRLAAGVPLDLLLTTDLAAVNAAAPEAAQTVALAQDSILVAGRSELSLGTANVLDRLMNPRTRIGVAFPEGVDQADPALRFFERVDALHAGSGAALRARARRLQPQGDLPSPRRIMELLGSGEVDVVLGAASALRTLSSVADLVVPPAACAVTITSYLSVLSEDGERRGAAQAYRAVLCGGIGQAMLTRHGFSPVALPV